MGILKAAEAEFARAHELCRIATVSRKGWPQVTPVIYALDGQNFIVAVDYGEKKLKNLRENDRASLVIDEFHPNKALAVQGRCEIIEKGREYLRLQKLLYDRFETYRRHPWKEGESPILKITPVKSASWGLE